MEYGLEVGKLGKNIVMHYLREVEFLEKSNSYKTVLSKISGVKESKVEKIWKEVKANNELLKNCIKPHDFSIEIKEKRKWQCSKCKGFINSIERVWYKEGLKVCVMAVTDDGLSPFFNHVIRFAP